MDLENQTQETQGTESKPVYKVGSGIPTVDDYREAEAHGFKADEEGQSQEANDTQDENTAVNNNPPAEETQQTAEGNESAFSMPAFGEETGTTGEEGSTDATGQQQAVVDWKAELKKADPKEILKELGYDEFLAEFAEYRKNGGDAYKYLEARAFDWNQVSHTELVKDDLRVQYPHLAEDKIEKLYQAKYKQSEFASEEDREIGSIQLEADAELVRQKRITEQKAFQIPEIARPQEANDLQQRMAEQQKLEAEQAQRVIEFFREHEATKSLYESKRVAIDLGDNGKFNFNIDKPENLMAVALDSEKWQRAIAINPQEADVNKLVPDVAKLQKIALVALNPNYEKDLVNYGKSLGLKAIVEEGQNARRPIGNTPAQPNESFAEAIKNRAKVSTLGR